MYTFAFDRFQLRSSPLILSVCGERLDLPPKTLQVLAALLKKAGRVVSKEDLLNDIWGDLTVEEGNLAVHVSALRKCLSRHGTSARIETVPKVGYVFCGSVRNVISDADFLPGSMWPAFKVATHFLKKRTHLGCRLAMRKLQKEIYDHPHNACAKVLLAEAHYIAFELGLISIESAVRRASVLLDSAEQINPTDPELWLMRAKFKESSAWRWDEAEADCLYALELDANSASIHGFLGRHLCRRGEFDRGQKHLLRALALDPVCPTVQKFYLDSLWFERRFEAAIPAAVEALQMHAKCWFLQLPAARTHLALSDYSGALKYYRHALLQSESQRPTVLAEITYAHAAAGIVETSIQLVKQLDVAITRGNYVSQVSLARTYLALGDEVRAIATLEIACARKDMFVSWLKCDPRFDRLRTQSRFTSLLLATGL